MAALGARADKRVPPPGTGPVAPLTDLGWSWGDGTEVAGTSEALSLALTGRTVALTELTGPGADVLAARAGR